MCGICGFVGIEDPALGATTLQSMITTLAHRGPDGSGTWHAPEGRVGLGHTRLSIIDLESGAQPMKSIDGQFLIVFNGEIYNFQELRRDLERLDHWFATRSDTEVVLEAYRRWGAECLERFRGMFAFAIYDVRERRLFLARDRTGIKPLYYHAGKGGFFFGSEIKAVLAAPVPRRLDYRALADFLRLGYPLLPATMFADIQELEPGSWMEVTSDSGIRRGRFWEWKRSPKAWRDANALETSEEALTESLKDHLVSDVPVGAFLSGGIDSSLLAALLVRKLGVRIDTFNVRFGEAAYDESAYARAVAAHLGTRHHEIAVEGAFGSAGDDGEEALELADCVLTQFDQPFGDSSAIPTYLVCKEIRRYVKVALSGDGGDEMFGGYSRFWHADVAQRLATMPAWSRLALRKASKALRPLAPNRFREAQRLLNAASANGDRLLSICGYATPAELPAMLQPSFFQQVIDYKPAFCLNGHAGGPSGEDLVDSTVRFTLPGDYLRKVDVMSSAHGLEVRVPFLGEPVLECGAQLPNSLKYRGPRNKLLLRKLAARYLPAKVSAKPKRGFGIPLDRWLGPSGRQAVRGMLESPRAGIHAIVRRTYSSPLLEGFASGQWDRSSLSRYGVYQRVYALWSLERWLQRWQPSL
jgi:asparagine synthase (glutamine-hydrolysing)